MADLTMTIIPLPTNRATASMRAAHDWHAEAIPTPPSPRVLVPGTFPSRECGVRRAAVPALDGGDGRQRRKLVPMHSMKGEGVHVTPLRLICMTGTGEGVAFNARPTIGTNVARDWRFASNDTGGGNAMATPEPLGQDVEGAWIGYEHLWTRVQSPESPGGVAVTPAEITQLCAYRRRRLSERIPLLTTTVRVIDGLCRSQDGIDGKRVKRTCRERWAQRTGANVIAFPDQQEGPEAA